MPASTSFYFSRSVRFRVEIGRVPHRDRSYSVPRSVEFRVEIGPVPVGVCGGLVVWDVVCLVGVGVLGVAHGRVGPLRGGSWFCWNDRLSMVSVVCGGRAPMCNEGVCAYGNPTMTATDNAVPHDSAVPADAGRARVCNINCGDMRGYGDGAGGDVPLRVPPAWHMQASVRAGSRRCGPTHPAFSPENHPTEDHARSTHPCLRCPDTPQSRRRTGPISSRNSTDLGTGFDRSRGGSGPISAYEILVLWPHRQLTQMLTPGRP